MRSHSDILDHILREKLIAVLRLDDPAHALEIAETLVAAGIVTIEVTLTTPGAIDLIERLAGRGDLVVGAGTLLATDSARDVFEAGALFFASPIVDPVLIELARQRDRVSMPGAYTPTEIVSAVRAGADLVKLFPMPPDAPRFIRSLLAPLPDLKLAPSGGVTDITAPELLRAGAAALNVGSWLTHESDGSIAPFATIHARAASLLESIRSFREA